MNKSNFERFLMGLIFILVAGLGAEILLFSVKDVIEQEPAIYNVYMVEKDGGYKFYIQDKNKNITDVINLIKENIQQDDQIEF